MRIGRSTPWVDPGQLRELAASVRDGFESAPLWARIVLLGIVAVGVLSAVFRVFRSVAGRVAALVAFTVLLVVVRFVVSSGSEIPWPEWLRGR